MRLALHRILIPLTAVWLWTSTEPQMAIARTTSYAIVIGNNAPPAGAAGEQLGVLRYADDDAVRFYQLFRSFAHEVALLTVLDRPSQRRHGAAAHAALPPTTENVRAVIRQISQRVAAERARGHATALYFVFSGHGAMRKNGEAELVLLDGGLTRQVLEEMVSSMPTTYIHFIVDACHAGSVVGVRDAGLFDREVEANRVPVSPADVLPLLATKSLVRHPSVGVVLATTRDERSHEWSELEAGVFSHEVISGLLGAADVNGDQKIEYTELQAFVGAANRGIVDPRAIPRVIAHPPALNHRVALVSLDTLRNAAVLTGRVAGLGHFHIELESGQRYLDAHLRDGVRAMLVLPSRGVAYLRTRTHEAELRLEAGRSIALAALRFQRQRSAKKGGLEHALHRGFFSWPFGPQYYQGFVDSVGAIGVDIEPAPGPLRPRPRADRGRRAVAKAMAVTAGLAATSAGISAFLAWLAKRDFERTTLQAQAYGAAHRYKRYSWSAWISGGIALSAGVTAWLLWPNAPKNLYLEVDDRRNPPYAVGVRMSW